MGGQTYSQKKKKTLSKHEKKLKRKANRIRNERIYKPFKFTRPFQIGAYAPGTAPDRIPYHLYLLVKEAVNSSSLDDLTRAEKKINFFCDYFYSHLPVGWKYDRDNAAPLVASCDSFFAKAGPKYNMSGYAPLIYPVENEFDIATMLHTDMVFEIMNIVHSRQTPSSETFMRCEENFISFYCKICSCFGLDYHNLEAASEDDVVLMNMGMKILSCHLPHLANYGYKRTVERILPNEDSHMRKLSTSDEAFELSKIEIREILDIIRSGKLPPQATFTRWNKYQISFYCKMCYCFDVDYRQLEAAFSELCL